MSASSASVTNDSWRVDETYVKVKGVWISLSRAVDSQGNTLEFHLSATRDTRAAKSFFGKALGASHTVTPRVITVDKNAAYPKALQEIKTPRNLPETCELRPSKYLNNVIEQIIGSSNGWSNQGWASFRLKQHGEHYRDRK